MKKTMELALLCDIQACVVTNDVDGEVTTWPENQSEVMKILQRSKKDCASSGDHDHAE